MNTFMGGGNEEYIMYLLLEIHYNGPMKAENSYNQTPN